ncbi:MAG TPA: hypothetical protein VGJ04_02505 [Pirellulales bacterium]
MAAGVIAQGSSALAQARAMRMGPRLQWLLQQQEQQNRSGPVDPNAPAPPEVDGLGPWLKRFHETVPQTAAEFAALDADALTQATDAVEQWMILWGRVAAGQTPPEQINTMGRLLDAKQFVDRELDNLLITRTRFAMLPTNDNRHAALRGYLLAASRLIDLSGRLRYDMVDILDDTADRLAEYPGPRERLLELLSNKQNSLGALVMAVDLIDAAPVNASSTGDPNSTKTQTTQLATLSPRERRMAMRVMSGGINGGSPSAISPNGINGANVNPIVSNSSLSPTAALSSAQKIEVIQLMAAAGTIDSVSDLSAFVLDDATPPNLVLAAAEAIRKLGLPQDPRPGQSDSVPAPAITVAKLVVRIGKIDAAQWTPEERGRVESLMTWLSQRNEHGLEGNTYQLGQFAVQPGDWLLMRNPSPYNLFTDLSPGLFTHVGVVTAENGSDGKRRMVVVDLEERGTSIPATNVETFLDRTLNYVFLRHPDAEVAREMGEAAAAIIGNPAEFDLNFRTDRIAALKGLPLAGQKIQTYCAGLLLLCAQQTDEPRDVFFPITETTAAGYTSANIAKFGLSLGTGFVSPTGALFSPRLQIVGRSEPMYDPQRQIEQAIYDHFAQLIQEKDLHPTDDLFQALRLKVAEASKSSPLLATALAASANVSSQMDLVSAAKTAAVIETLDEIATVASREFQEAREAIVEGVPAIPIDGQPASGDQRQLTPEQRAAINKYRSRHADLAARWDQRQISPRGLRLELVKYYIQQGYRQLDERLGSGEK